MKYFSTFSGVGGFELGIEYAHISTAKGFEQVRNQNNSPVNLNEQMGTQQFTCVGFSEVDKYASAVLKYQYPNIKNYGDIKQINWGTVPDFDLLVGGSPCQDLSVAGKQAGLTGERSGLFSEYVRALKEKQPNHFIWENVKGALSSNQGRDFAEIINQFSEAGYSLWWQVLNAKDFGVPQNRERIFVVGTRNGSPRQILFERNPSKENTGERAAKTLRSHAGGFSERDNFVALTERRTEEAKKIRREMMKKGKDWSPRRGKVLMPRTDDMGNCVTAGQGKEHLLSNGFHLRRLTPIECERLMAWPDNWTRLGNFDGEVMEISDTQRYKMCGNGVVSSVIEQIVIEHLLT